MTVSWLFANRICLAISVLVVCLAIVVPPLVVEVFSAVSDPSVEKDLGISLPKPDRSKKTPDPVQVPAPSDVDLIKATSLSLHRMRPPQPAPPEPPPIVAPIPVDTVLFPGSLVGVIRDSDPSYCFAVLKWPDNRIQLVANGGNLNENSDSPKISEVKDDSVILVQGERTQTLDLQGTR